MQGKFPALISCLWQPVNVTFHLHCSILLSSSQSTTHNVSCSRKTRKKSTPLRGQIPKASGPAPTGLSVS